MAGRGLGHTGGTIDKLESIRGYRAQLTIDEIVDVVDRVGCCIVGQTGELAPADKVLYAIRDTTATTESLPLIAGIIITYMHMTLQMYIYIYFIMYVCVMY